MADFTNSKGYGTAMYPVHALETSGLIRRCESLLTPEQLVGRYLLGIPLTFPNGDSFTPDLLKDRIHLAVNEVETLIGRNINREQFKEKVPFDYALYRSFIHIRAEHGPITSIEQLAIVTSDNNNVFELPASWIETANFSKNQINVIPLLAAYGVNAVQGSSTGSAVGAGTVFLTILGGLGWVPAYWQITYTAGLSNKEGQVPVIVNDLIGTVAAMEVLSLIAPTNIFQSQSLSQDGISQSSSGPGPQIYRVRLEELEKKKTTLIAKIKGIFSSKFFVGNF